MTTSARSEFTTLFQGFLTSFLATPKGGEQIRLYLDAVKQGRENYRQISAAASRGEDVTDEVLRKLLPHANTRGNRGRDVWIHVAPAVTRHGARQVIEGAGWVRREDMPKAVAAILHFIRRSTLHPEQLRDAAAEFAALPFKGFQYGSALANLTQGKAGTTSLLPLMEG